MKSIVWELFEIFVNFYQGIIMTYFLHSYLGNKSQKIYIESSGIMYALCLTIIISVFNYAMYFEHFFALVYVCVLLIYAKIHLYGTFQRKIFASVYSVLIILIPSALVTNIMAVIFHSDLNEIFIHDNVERLITIIIGQLVILYFFFLSLRIFVKKHSTKYELTKTEWILISLVLLISIVIGCILNMLSIKLPAGNGQLYLAIAVAGLVLINVGVCYFVSDLDVKSKVIQENEMLKLQQEYSKQYIKNASVEYEALRKLRHDFKNNYSVIYTLVSENKTDKGLEFISRCIETLMETEIFVNTNNDIVNAVINSKFSIAKSFGIECTCFSINDFKDIDDSDLCRLLSNMLDNAVAACIQSHLDNKSINLKIKFDDYNYIFNLKNTIDKSVLKNNPQLITTKSDKTSHGMGTIIIQEIAEKYNGECNFYEEKSFFCCNVVLSKINMS